MISRAVENNDLTHVFHLVSLDSVYFGISIRNYTILGIKKQNKCEPQAIITYYIQWSSSKLNLWSIRDYAFKFAPVQYTGTPPNNWMLHAPFYDFIVIHSSQHNVCLSLWARMLLSCLMHQLLLSCFLNFKNSKKFWACFGMCERWVQDVSSVWCCAQMRPGWCVYSGITKDAVASYCTCNLEVWECRLNNCFYCQFLGKFIDAWNMKRS